MLGAWVLAAVITLVLPSPRARGLWLDENDLRHYKFKIAPVYPFLWIVVTSRACRPTLRGKSN